MRALLSILVVSALALCAASGQAASPGDIIINEVMQNPNAVLDSEGEWFELYNTTASGIDIDGWTIRDDDLDGHIIDNGGSLVVPANGYLVLGCNANPDSNGGYTCDYEYGSGWYLANGADEVVLEDDLSAEIARINYDGGTDWPDPTGASMGWTGPPGVYTDGTDWVEETVVQYGDGDYGTPGGPNSAATGVDPATWGKIKAKYR